MSKRIVAVLSSILDSAFRFIGNMIVRKETSKFLKTEGAVRTHSLRICSSISFCSGSVFPSVCSVIAWREKPSSYTKEILSVICFTSLYAMVEVWGMNARNGIFSSWLDVNSGTTVMLSRRSIDSWVSISKDLMVSISSPKKSIR